MADKRFEALVESITQQQKHRTELEIKVLQLQSLKSDKETKIQSLQQVKDKLKEDNLSREKRKSQLANEKNDLNNKIDRERMHKTDMSFTLKAVNQDVKEKESEFSQMKLHQESKLNEIISAFSRQKEIMLEFQGMEYDL